MGPGHDEGAGARRAAGLIVVGMMLSGCSTGVGSSDGWFNNRITGLLTGATPGTSQPASPIESTPSYNCPGVDIRPGASTLNIAARSAQATAGDLRYQISFAQTARECIVTGDSMSIKVGVQGRIILGPMGGPGIVDVPLRYAVVREGPQPRTIATKFKRLPVTVPADQTHVPFLDVEERLAFPLPPGNEIDAYVIYVGFDDLGDKSEKKPAKSTRKPAPRQQ
jgi:hypothetical protein